MAQSRGKSSWVISCRISRDDSVMILPHKAADDVFLRLLFITELASGDRMLF